MKDRDRDRERRDAKLLYPPRVRSFSAACPRRQRMAQRAVRGTPFTRMATPQCRFSRALVAARPNERTSALIDSAKAPGKGAPLPWPAGPALRLGTFGFAESCRRSGGVH